MLRLHPSLVLVLALFAGVVVTPGEELESLIGRGDLAGAEVLLEELAADWESAWSQHADGGAALEFGRTLQALGVIERQAGKPEEALGHLKRAVELLAGAGVGERADLLEARALALQDCGDPAAAESVLREVLAMRESLPGDQREPAAGLTRDHLALALLVGGKYPEAGELLRGSLAATPQGDTMAQARRQGNLGRYWHTLGSHARAAGEFRAALELLEEGGVEAPELALSLRSQLALAELRLGRGEEARWLFEEAAGEARELYAAPALRFRAAPHLNNLGALALAEGDAQLARDFFQEALARLEESLGTEHPALISPLNNLGCACQMGGDYERAGGFLERAAALQEKHLPRVHLRVAETARNLAANAVLAGRPDARERINKATGLGVELLGELVHHGSEGERLNFLQRIDLVSLPCATGDGPMIAGVLIAGKARLLGAMLGEAEESAAEVPGWREVQAALGPGMAMVDCCRYTTIGPEPVERYGAVVLLSAGEPQWVELGSELSLQYWLRAFRERLAWRSAAITGREQEPPVLRLRAILGELHRLFWEPLASVLPDDVSDIAFSPDGALHFLPLPVLLDKDGRLLCERHRQVVTVISARDLLADPPGESLRGVEWALFGVDEYLQPAVPPGGDELADLLAGLSPMPGVRDELRRLERVAPPRSQVHLGKDANEKALRSITRPPGVLHLGSHAFFPHQRLDTPEVVFDFDERGDLLLAGGLLLHRAAMRDPRGPLMSPDDDLLYPAEVARLSLWGTRLVTLSSCESGVGTAVSGEGLLGLRRGFTLAGAHEVVVALWPVSDRAAPGFMERFYRLAISSDRPAQALWQTQRELTGPPASAGDDEAFEFAVLRFAPFVLSQHGPLRSGPVIEAAPLRWQTPWRRLWWALPLVVFLGARWWLRRGSKGPAST